MPALAPQEELEITTRRAPAYGARATSRGARQPRDFDESDLRDRRRASTRTAGS